MKDKKERGKRKIEAEGKRARARAKERMIKK